MESRKIIVKKAMQSSIRWPQECATCGKEATKSSDLMTGEKIWQNKNTSESTITPVPYCEECYAKIQNYEKIHRILKTITLAISGLIMLIGWPLIFYSQISNIQGYGVLGKFALTIALTILGGSLAAVLLTFIPLWGPFYLLVMLSDRFQKPVQAGEHEKDGVEINFPRGEYAVKFNALNKGILWGEWDERSIEAEVEQVKHIEAKDVCWFCMQDLSAGGLPLEANLAKEGEEDQSIWIPCCTDCNILHRETGCGLLGFLGGLMILAGGAGFGYFLNDTLRFWSWVIGIVVSLILLIVLITWLALKNGQKEQKMTDRALEYPAVKELLEQGWKIKSESPEEK